MSKYSVNGFIVVVSFFIYILFNTHYYYYLKSSKDEVQRYISLQHLLLIKAPFCAGRFIIIITICALTISE